MQDIQLFQAPENGIDPKIWILAVVVAALGGLAHHLVTNSSALIIPHRSFLKKIREESSETPITTEEKLPILNLGAFSDMVIGIVAAVTILLYVPPTDTLHLLGLSATAGFGGSALLGSISNKLTGEVIRREVVKTTDETLTRTTEITRRSETSVADAHRSILTYEKAIIKLSEKVIELAEENRALKAKKGMR